MNQQSTPRRRLGRELRRLRDLAKLSSRDLVRAMAIAGINNQPAVTRIEAGRMKISRPQLEAWVTATNASAEERATVLELLETAVRDESAWYNILSGRTHLQDEMREKEAAAHTIRNFQPTVIPGLLQTIDYAKHVIPIADVDNVIDHDAAATVRLERQQILLDKGRRFEFLLGESALRWPASLPGLLADQLDRIVVVAGLDAVEVAVLPIGQPPDVLPWSNFIIFEGDEATTVHMELAHKGESVMDVPQVDIYRRIYTKLWSAALTGRDAVALIQRIAAELRG